MKIICLSFDECAFSRQLTDEEYKTIDFNSPFGICEECNYYSLIVEDDFQITFNDDFFINSIRTLNKVIKHLNE